VGGGGRGGGGTEWVKGDWQEEFVWVALAQQCDMGR
jgi:hypothetical protein